MGDEWGRLSGDDCVRHVLLFLGVSSLTGAGDHGNGIDMGAVEDSDFSEGQQE